MAYPCLCTGRSKEFLRRLPNLRPQEDHGDQVWNGQEAKSNVLDRPDHIAFQGKPMVMIVQQEAHEQVQQKKEK